MSIQETSNGCQSAQEPVSGPFSSLHDPDSVKALFAALAAFQAAVPSIPKTRTATVGSYSYSYADLADTFAVIRPLLAQNGLSVTQEVTSDIRSGYVLVTTRIHHKDGASLTYGPLAIPGGDTPQKVGTAITYARRYSLSAALGIVTDDDDDAVSHEHDKRAHKQAISDAAIITRAKVSKIYAVSRSIGITEEQLKSRVLQLFGQAHGWHTTEDVHIDQLTRTEADYIIDRLVERERQMKAERADGTGTDGAVDLDMADGDIEF